MLFYRVNAGHKAVDNGSFSPLTALFALAEITDQKVITGRTYGDDYLIVPEDSCTREIIENLMTERKLIWEIVPELPVHLRGYVA